MSHKDGYPPAQLVLPSPWASNAASQPAPPSDRGPTGQWPDGTGYHAGKTAFPAYTTAADQTTDGTMADLESKIDALGAGGGVVEHAGDINSLTLGRVSGSGTILIRPPIGERADYDIIECRIQESNMLVAGYAHLSGEMNVGNGSNSGFAWIETLGANIGGGLSVFAINGSPVEGWFWEIVERTYGDFGGDKGGVRQDGAGSTTTMWVIGSWITGSTSPPPEAHSDTWQTAATGGATNGVLHARDSVLWPSNDKVIQGENDDPAGEAINCWLCSPSEANTYWSLSMEGFFAITAFFELNDSVINGGTHIDFDVEATDCTYYDSDQLVLISGNTEVFSFVDPVAAPSSAQLDTIWST